VKGKSSHYGLHMLGYTCATKTDTKGSDGEILSKTWKTVSVRIATWNPVAWSRNR